MKLNYIMKNTEYIDFIGDNNVSVKNLSSSSKSDAKDNLFFCIKGLNFDAHNVADEAIKKGAVALVVEDFLNLNVPQIKVKNVRASMAQICNVFYNNVLDKLKLIGITGTNGKTTTTYILKEILSIKSNVAVVGTNGVVWGNKFYKCSLTTPDPIELFYIFNRLSLDKVGYVIIEVSAHAISLNKIKGLKFEVGLFTNLTQDHLDYFKTIDIYAKTKQIFLKKEFCHSCVFNMDDQWGRQFFKDCDVQKIGYSLFSPSDIFAIDIKSNQSSTGFVVNCKDTVFEVFTNLIGKFNIYNVLGAIGVCKFLKVSVRDIIIGLANLKGVEGRFDVVKNKDNYVVVDYAHTPDGLQNILINVKAHFGKKIICVFGCGGNRDATKRPIMGQIAQKYADKVFVTSDNPRLEKPQIIIDEILSNLKNRQNIWVILDRKQAILKALSMQNDGEYVVVICGKGAEKYQEICNKKIPFDDKALVNDYFNKIMGNN